MVKKLDVDANQITEWKKQLLTAAPDVFALMALIDRPNQVWTTDITYFPRARGFVYLGAILDWHSRRVLNHEGASQPRR